MEQALIESFNFYIIAIAVGSLVGAFATILYSGLYSLRS